MRPLRILYAYRNDPGSTARQRLHALRALGHDVTPFDMRRYREKTWVMSKFLAKVRWSPNIARMNRDLLAESCASAFDWVWIDKGILIFPETIRGFQQQVGVKVIHYTPDPALTFHRTRHFSRSIPLYDALITTKSYEQDLYRQAGAQRLIFVQQGYDPELFRPVDVPPDLHERIKSDVCFVGHYEEHYARSLEAAADVSPNLKFWGTWWDSKIGRHPSLRTHYQNGGVWDQDYVNVLNATKIALGFLARLAPDQATTRTFEIPACGAMLLAERTAEHESLYDDGKEAVFYDGLDELREKLAYYLAHDEEREQIAAAGRERCLRSDYAHTGRFRVVFAELERMGLLETSPARRVQ